MNAFGPAENPASMGKNPSKCASKLANFITDNHLDGVNIDWADTQAFENGIAEQWLITFTNELRSLIPDHIISHSPRASHFKTGYPEGGYSKVNTEVG